MSEGQIVVTAERLSEASGNTLAAASNIQNTLEQLKSYLAPLLASWDGQASGDYQSLQRRWDQSASDLFAPPEGVLPRIARALQTAAENYQQAERGTTSIWNG